MVVSSPKRPRLACDACPGVIKDILFRAANRTGTLLTLVANQSIHVPASPFIRTIRVGSGFDIADNEIVKRVEAGDLVVTADIPLAAEVIEKGGHALNPRGNRSICNCSSSPTAMHCRRWRSRSVAVRPVAS